MRNSGKRNIIKTKKGSGGEFFLNRQSKFTVRDLSEIGVLAALVFVATYFIKFGPIPTLAGPTMLKTGNAVCLLGAMLFGKTKHTFFLHGKLTLAFGSQ